MYRSAFLGCGPRARQHADAYRFVKQGKMVAICDLDEKRLDAFGQEFNIQACYTDIHAMLGKERPDLLHIVTSPGLRVPLMSIAADYEVPVVIIEKPIAIQGEDFRQICEIKEKSSTRFVVNHQLYFHARNLEFKRDVAQGRIGEVRFIDISAGSTILNQGVHVLELAHTYNGCAAPKCVFGNVSGVDAFSTSEPSPDVVQASIDFENGVRAQVLCGSVAPRINENDNKYLHKRIAVYGTEGFIHWTIAGWERFTPKGGYESGEHDYWKEDMKAQARLTDAAFDWLRDEKKVHPNRLECALTQFRIILGIYLSALQMHPVHFPFDIPEGQMDSLKARLERRTSGR